MFYDEDYDEDNVDKTTNYVIYATAVTFNLKKHYDKTISIIEMIHLINQPGYKQLCMEQAREKKIESSQVYLLPLEPEGELSLIFLERLNTCRICRSALIKLLGIG